MSKKWLYFFGAVFDALIFLGTTLFATLLAINWYNETNGLFYFWLILPAMGIGFRTWIEYMKNN